MQLKGCALLSIVQDEADTLRYMGPREQARRVAVRTYKEPIVGKLNLLRECRSFGLPVATIIDTWRNLGAMELELGRLAA